MVLFLCERSMIFCMSERSTIIYMRGRSEAQKEAAKLRSVRVKDTSINYCMIEASTKNHMIEQRKRTMVRPNSILVAHRPVGPALVILTYRAQGGKMEGEALNR